LWKIADTMEIFEANVLIQLVTERKQHCNVSRANNGLLVHVRHRMSIPKFKHKMQTWNSQSQSSNLHSLRRVETIFYEFSRISKMVKFVKFFPNFKTVGYEFSIDEIVERNYLCVVVRSLVGRRELTEETAWPCKHDQLSLERPVGQHDPSTLLDACTVSATHTHPRLLSFVLFRS